MSLLIGPRNCEEQTGLPWRHVRDHYRHLARPVGRKLVIPADALAEALRRGTPEPEAITSPTDPAEALRAMLGWRPR